MSTRATPNRVERWGAGTENPVSSEYGKTPFRPARPSGLAPRLWSLALFSGRPNSVHRNRLREDWRTAQRPSASRFRPRRADDNVLGGRSFSDLSFGGHRTVLGKREKVLTLRDSPSQGTWIYSRWMGCCPEAKLRMARLHICP